MESPVNIYFYVIVYIVLLFFILSNNNEKTAIVTLITINILLYSNLEIKKICKTIFAIVILTQLLDFYNFNRIKEAMGGWPNDIQNLRNTPFAAPTPVDSYYLNDRQDECGSSNTCDLGLAPGLYNSMITSYPDLIINNNNNMLNELYSINLIFYNKCKKIADNLNIFNNNVTNDYIACNLSNNTYSYTNNNNNKQIKKENNRSCNLLKETIKIIRKINNIIGMNNLNNTTFKMIDMNCSEQFTGKSNINENFISGVNREIEYFTSHVTREIEYFSNNNTNNYRKIKEGYDTTNTIFSPQSGWFKVNLNNIDCSRYYNPTSIQLEKTQGGGLLCEIFDIDESKYRSIKESVAPALYKNVCKTIQLLKSFL